MTTDLQRILPEAAARHGTRIALISGSDSVSFDDLHRLSARFALALIGLGVAPGDRVTLCAANGLPWVLGYHGALRAGAIVNPVNMMLTAPEIGFVLRDCGARVLLASGERAAALAKAGVGDDLAACICLDGQPPAGWLSFDAMLDAAAGQLVSALPARKPDDPSTIGYTSGTTGHPKGAVLSHRAVYLNAAMTALMHGRTAADTVVTALPAAHVYGNVVMNGALMTGMTLVLMPRFDAATAILLIDHHRATMFEGVPAMYLTMLDCPELPVAGFPSLTRCTVGGQTMPVAAMEAVEHRFGAPLIELWGMTEIAGLGTTHPFPWSRSLGSIGVGLPFMQTRIVGLEDGDTELPRGTEGELQVRGPTVMQGYFGNEAATHETIRLDGWLHTGDIATMDDMGHITVIDRRKDVILSGGYNIYPAEIERALALHPDVALAAVGRVPDPVKGEAPAAYVVRRRGASATEADLIAHLRSQLAAWKCPRLLRFVDDLPRTSSGKIRRAELARSFGDAEPSAPGG